MKFVIREFENKDKKIVSSFVGELQQHIVDIDPIKRVKKNPGYETVFAKKLFDDVSQKQGKIFVAETNGEVIGFAAGIISKQSKENLLELRPTKLGVLIDLFVAKKFRSKKVGSELYRRVEEYLKEQGCDSLWVEVVAYNEVARHLYSQQNFMVREIGMLKKLD